MNKIIKELAIVFALIITISFVMCNNSTKNIINALDIAKTIAAKGDELVRPGGYPGILNIHAMAEIAEFEGNDDYLRYVRELLAAFGTEEIKSGGNFACYESGGTGAAYLVFKGLAPELKSQVVDTAHRMMEIQPRSSEGLLVSFRHADSDKDPIFIDVAFATTPYLLYTGLILDRDDYIDFAVFETLERIKILRDSQTGLIHQARGFQAKDFITEDCWSRGNGWASLALAILIRDLPENHYQRAEVEKIAKNFFEAVLRFQNKEGLWHQEMTDFTSYVETSGSGLLLYGLGIAIEHNILDDSHLPDLKRGLTNFLAYVTEDGSISHTSRSTLAPGDGKKEDFAERMWIFNDQHAFGAASLAFVQAAKMGIKDLKIPFELGYIAVDSNSE